MKKTIVFLFVLCFVLSVINNKPSAEEPLNQDDLENVTLSLLQPTIIKALKDHYGGITQFEELTLVKIVPRQLPADLKDDSAFKSPGSIYEITLQLTAFVHEGKKEKVTLVLSNEFSKNGYDVATFNVE